jgi:hypothetical protein
MYIKQGTDGSTGIPGPGGGEGQFVCLRQAYIATSVDSTMFTAGRRYIVKSVSLRPDVIGSDGGTVTVAVKIAASGTAIASGTAVHSGTLDLKGTAHTTQSATLSTTASELILDAGSSIGLDFTGTMTAAVGTVSVELCPA